MVCTQHFSNSSTILYHTAALRVIRDKSKKKKTVLSLVRASAQSQLFCAKTKTHASNTESVGEQSGDSLNVCSSFDSLWS